MQSNLFLLAVVPFLTAAPVPKQLKLVEHCKFQLADKLEGASWGLNLELQWHTDPKADGGLVVDSWDLISSVGGVTKEQLIANLFNGKKVGATADYETKGEYLAVVTEMTPRDKTFKTGEQTFPGGPKGGVVKTCGYHEVDAKFALYANKNRKFTFEATAGDKIITDIAMSNQGEFIGSGRVRIDVFHHPDSPSDYFVKAEADLGAQTFGVNTRAHGKWKAEDEVKALAMLKTVWRIESYNTRK